MAIGQTETNAKDIGAKKMGDVAVVVAVAVGEAVVMMMTMENVGFQREQNQFAMRQEIDASADVGRKNDVGENWIGFEDDEIDEGALK